MYVDLSKNRIEGTIPGNLAHFSQRHDYLPEGQLSHGKLTRKCEVWMNEMARMSEAMGAMPSYVLQAHTLPGRDVNH